MQGPYEVKNIELKEPNEELLWIVGYETNVVKKDLSANSNAGFMCHNNLNYAISDELISSLLELKTKITVCSGALNENNIIESELRKDIIFNISGLTSILNPKNSHNQIIFI